MSLKSAEVIAARRRGATLSVDDSGRVARGVLLTPNLTRRCVRIQTVGALERAGVIVPQPGGSYTLTTPEPPT